MKALSITTLLIFGFPFFATAALAEGKGWSGSVGLVVGAVSGEGQLDAYGGKKRIESLDAKPAQYNYDFLFPEFKVSYTFQNDITAYVDGSLLDGGKTGVSYTFNDGTMLSVSLPLFLGTSADVWQDPYLTGRDRKTTEARLKNAIGFSLENIGGLYAGIDYTYQDLSIKNDRAGESLNARLTPAEIKQLQRSNKSHRISASLPPFMLSSSLYLMGGASYTHTSAEGLANSFTAQSVELTLAYEKRHFEAFTHISGGVAKYRAVNPLFNTERRDELNTVAVGIAYGEPFNWKNSTLELTIASEHLSSNINFYDTRVELLTTSFNYHF
ncbi:MAG: DUF2860 domain-containing protein [Gammaproteobacteria bacterium]|nr:DUF2860 domain-containing protein [Gammaproteobacteria bacterium]